LDTTSVRSQLSIHKSKKRST
jgi:hypothetical protein